MRLYKFCIFAIEFLEFFHPAAEKCNLSECLKVVSFALLFDSLDDVVGTLRKGVCDPVIEVIQDVLASGHECVSECQELR